MAGGIGLIGPAVSLASSAASSGKGGGGGNNAVSQQDIQSALFEHQQGKIAANQFGAQTGTGNNTGVATAQSANDVQLATTLGQLAQQQQVAALNAQQNASSANGLLAGLGGNFGSTGGSFGSTGGNVGNTGTT